MKTLFHLLLLPALIAGITSVPAGRVTAQTFTTVHKFYGSDGGFPRASLIVSGNTLYGTTSRGGTSDNGTVFAVNTDGTGFTTLHDFPIRSTNSSGIYTNNDGTDVEAGLILSGGTLYGTAAGGGSSGNGTVFAVGTNGAGFTILHDFAGYPGDGAFPRAGLILTNNILYGTTVGGGNFPGFGTVFAVGTDGTGFTSLHSFTPGGANTNGYYTNSGGLNPEAGLLLSGNTLYGTAVGGGSSANGTVFAVDINGTGFTTLHNFSAAFRSAGDGTNSDGINPKAGLILSGNTLYGTTWAGGSSDNGTVFAVNTNGMGFTNLHSFTGISDLSTNEEGAGPWAGLILYGNTLYGTTVAGGSWGFGTLFAINTDGTGLKTLHDFAQDDGTNPFAGLVLSRNTLYGTGGDYWNFFASGTVFSLSFRPQLNLNRSGANVVLSWPTNVAGFDCTGYILQSTTNLISSPIWSTNSPAPIVINGQNRVTNPISGPQKFYRLSQ